MAEIQPVPWNRYISRGLRLRKLLMESIGSETPPEIEEGRQHVALEIAADVLAGVELALKHYQNKTGALRRQSGRESRLGTRQQE